MWIAQLMSQKCLVESIVKSKWFHCFCESKYIYIYIMRCAYIHTCCRDDSWLTCWHLRRYLTAPSVGLVCEKYWHHLSIFSMTCWRAWELSVFFFGGGGDASYLANDCWMSQDERQGVTAERCETFIRQTMDLSALVSDSDVFGNGMRRSTFQWKKGVFSEKGGGNSVNGGFGNNFYSKGNSVKRFGPFT